MTIKKENMNSTHLINPYLERRELMIELTLTRTRNTNYLGLLRLDKPNQDLDTITSPSLI